jgi:hypothetical protein
MVLPADDGAAASLQVGDLLRISVALVRQWAEVDTGFRSPLVRVKAIRRDAANEVELVLEPIHAFVVPRGSDPMTDHQKKPDVSQAAQTSGPGGGLTRIRMLRDDNAYRTGQTVDVPEGEAQRLVQAGAAELVTPF